MCCSCPGQFKTLQTNLGGKCKKQWTSRVGVGLAPGGGVLACACTCPLYSRRRREGGEVGTHPRLEPNELHFGPKKQPHPPPTGAAAGLGEAVRFLSVLGWAMGDVEGGAQRFDGSGNVCSNLAGRLSDTTWTEFVIEKLSTSEDAKILMHIFDKQRGKSAKKTRVKRTSWRESWNPLTRSAATAVARMNLGKGVCVAGHSLV